MKVKTTKLFKETMLKLGMVPESSNRYQDWEALLHILDRVLADKEARWLDDAMVMALSKCYAEAEHVVELLIEETINAQIKAYYQA